MSRSFYWQSFSIGRGELTRFLQQSPQSAVLNRVVGGDPSTILGALQSNGRVFLINPNGIVFGQGAQIDVAGLVASSLKMSDADFLAGRLKFGDTPGAGAVVNQGAITTPRGGTVYLIAPQVENSGIIVSPKGEVVLAAGKTVEIVDAASPNLRVEITAPDNQVVNLGQIIAQGGRVTLAVSAIRQAGVISADSAVVGENGKIVLKATKSVTLEEGSRTTANGPSGGSVTVQATEGDVIVRGTVEARAILPTPLLAATSTTTPQLVTTRAPSGTGTITVATAGASVEPTVANTIPLVLAAPPPSVSHGKNPNALAREEAERQAREEAERLARDEAERVAREEAERQAREEGHQLRAHPEGR